MDGGFFAGGVSSPSAPPRGGADASPGTKRQARDKKTLFPLTLRQLLSSTPSVSGDAWTIPAAGEAVDLNFVRIVGYVLTAEDGGDGTLTVALNDMTGRVEMKWYLDAADPASALAREALQPGYYVDVVAQVRLHNGKDRVITPVAVHKLTDPNALTMHILAAIQNYSFLARGPLVADGGASAAAAGHHGGPGLGFAGYNAYSMPSMNTGAALHAPGAGLAGDAVRNAIIDCIKAAGDPEGVSLDDLIAVAASVHANRAQVEATVSSMLSMGELFTTSDEFHFSTTVT